MIDLDKWSIWFCAAVVIAFIFGGCAPTNEYIAARKAESVMATTVMDAYGAWRVADLAKQKSIVAAAKSLSEAQSALKSWRDTDQTQVDKAFKAARDAVYAYDTALEAYKQGTNRNFVGVEANAIDAIKTLLGVLASYGVKIASQLL